MPLTRTLAAMVACSLIPLSSLAAVEFGPVGPRSLAMGGTGVAHADDALAQQHNPAMLATAPRTVGEGSDARPAGRHGMNVFDVSAGISLTGRLGDYLDTISDVDIKLISETPKLTEEQTKDVLRVSAALGGIDNPGNGVVVYAGAGSAVRWGNVAVGARFRAQAGGRVDELDRVNLGFENLDLSGINGDLDDLQSEQTGNTLNQAQKDALADAGIMPQNIDYLDFLLDDLVSQGAISPDDIQGAVDLLVLVVEASESGGDLDKNETVVTGRGIGIAEIPISYAYAITPELSVGATLRLMMGRVYGTTVRVLDDDNNDVLDDIDENYQTSSAITVDVGARFQYGRLTLGAVGRNLTKPTFKGFTTTNGVLIDDVSLDPQVSVGGALSLPWGLTIAAEGDLIETTSILRGFKEQYVRFGLEWDPIRVLELRVGAWNNIAQSDMDWVLTGGIGIDLWAIRIDLAGAISPFDTVNYDGDKYPQTAYVGLGLTAGF